MPASLFRGTIALKSVGAQEPSMQDAIQGTPPPETQVPRPRARALTRAHDRMLSGVAGGLADYFDIDPTIVRLGLVLTALITGGIVLIAYIALWIIMPEAPSNTMPGLASPDGAPVGARAGTNGPLILGIILVAVGGFVLLEQFPMFHMFGWGIARFWWPSLLIVTGLALIATRARD
jgi:phage shock protein PspC (stress-responsive transcriptional regulator)